MMDDEKEKLMEEGMMTENKEEIKKEKKNDKESKDKKDEEDEEENVC